MDRGASTVEGNLNTIKEGNEQEELEKNEEWKAISPKIMGLEFMQ